MIIIIHNYVNLNYVLPLSQSPTQVYKNPYLISRQDRGNSKLKNLKLKT